MHQPGQQKNKTMQGTNYGANIPVKTLQNRNSPLVPIRDLIGIHKIMILAEC